MKQVERESLHNYYESSDSEDESRRELRLDEEDGSPQKKSSAIGESSSGSIVRSSSMEVLNSSSLLEKPKIIDEDAKVFIEFASFFTSPENMNNSDMMNGNCNLQQPQQPPPPPLMDFGSNSTGTSTSLQIFSSGAAQSKPSSSIPSVIVSHHHDAPKPPSSMLIPIPIKTVREDESKPKKTKLRSLHKSTNPQVASSSASGATASSSRATVTTPVKRQTKPLREDDRIVSPSKFTQQIETPNSKKNEDLPRKKRGRPPGTKKTPSQKKVKEDYEDENQLATASVCTNVNSSNTRQPIEMPQGMFSNISNLNFIF